MNQNSTDRLERMEEKIDKLVEAIVALARAEQKILSLEISNAGVLQHITDLTKKLNRVEIQQITDGNTLKGLRKFFWVLVSSIIGGAFVVWFTVLATRVTGVPVH